MRTIRVYVLCLYVGCIESRRWRRSVRFYYPLLGGVALREARMQPVYFRMPSLAMSALYRPGSVRLT
jgi:hypothetical protein